MTLKKQDPLRSNQNRAQFAINAFWGICIINIIAIISGYDQLELLERIQANAFYTEQEIHGNDVRESIVGIFQSIFYITSIVLFLRWFNRSYVNLHRLNNVSLQYEESASIWSFFIPIISLYKPFKIAKEISTETRSQIQQMTGNIIQLKSHNSIINLWWILFIATNYIGQYAFKTILKEDTIEQMMLSTKAYLFSDFMDIPSAIVTLYMIKKIAQDEQQLFDLVEKKESELASHSNTNTSD